MTQNKGTGGGLKLEFPIFESYIAPNGFLPSDRAAHACFYFYMLAEKSKATAGKSIDDQRILEGEAWMSPEYVNIRRAVALLYQLDSPGDIDRYWPAVKMQASLLGLPEPSNEYMERKDRLNG